MVMPPLGLWYLASQLEAQGHTTDFRALDVDPLPADGEYDEMWVSATSPQMHAVRRISETVKEWDKTVTVFGGAASWARPEVADTLHFDLVVAGEADHPDTVSEILRITNRIKWHGPIQDVYKPAITPGPLAWVRPPVRRWDDAYSFYLADKTGKRHKTTTLFTSRGCPMACAFCESGRNGVIWDRAVRYEPVDIVDSQLREIVERGHTGAMFYDDILPLNKPRTVEIMKLMKKYNLIWRCFFRTDIVEKQGFDFLREMAESGLVEVLAGVESADNRIKANVHKGTTIEQDTQALEWCKELGIKFKASIILGLPGEDWVSLNKTREWILTQRPDRVDVNALIPMAGTPITKSHDYLGNKYDVEWDETDIPDEWFYKSKGRGASVLVRTSALSRDDIAEFRSKLVQEIIDAGIPY
jgi:radical SAM superfamily enzyme YgiQ (UPF0313 family)